MSRLSRRPHWDTEWHRAQVAEDNRLEREQDDADRGRDRYDDEDERRIEAGIAEWMNDD